MKLRGQFSIKGRMLLVLMGILIPLVLIFIFYNFYVVSVFNKKIAQSNENTMQLYIKILEEDLNSISNTMINMIANDAKFKQLSYEISNLEARKLSYDILEDYKKTMLSYPMIAGSMIISFDNNIFRTVYKSDVIGINYKEALEAYFKEYTKEKNTIVTNQWFTVSIDNYDMLCKINGYGGNYCIFFVNLDDIRLPQVDTSSSKNGLLIYYTDDNILTEKELIIQNNIDIISDKNYYFSGHPRNYIIIHGRVETTDLKCAYLVPYDGVLKGLDSGIVAIFIASFFTILIIPLGYLILKKTFYKPLDRLICTMKEIKEGNLDAKAHSTYEELEFQQVDDTFNDMIEQIKSLKIVSYEKELSIKQTQLQYYQIQVKPHFYLNCLKNIYGMVEEKNFENMQKLIIHLSNHLRYIMKDSAILVTIKEELSYVENYIKIQHLSFTYPPICQIEAESDVLEMNIPSISILTFVENSIKHGMISGKSLKISIRAHILKDEDGTYLNIFISDNGRGFSNEVLKVLNDDSNNEIGPNHIGINNVIQRYKLCFNEENVWFSFSNMNGAKIDIFVKL